MKQPSRNQTPAPRYLMGEMSERESDEFEEKYFDDDVLFGELLDAEDRLIDDYRRGRLSSDERERFEQRFLTLPDRRREVEFARLLAESLAERHKADLPAPNAEPAPQRRPLLSLPLFSWLSASWPAPGWALALIALIMILGSTWAALKTSRLQDQLDQNQARQAQQLEQARNERASLEEDLARLKTSTSPAAAILSLTLSPGASRSSGETKKVTPGSRTQMIEFTLEAGAENYAGYQASLQPADDENAEILIYKRLEAQKTGAGKIVVIRTPAAMLEIGDYQIKLEGIRPQRDAYTIGKYLFQVRRQ